MTPERPGGNARQTLRVELRLVHPARTVEALAMAVSLNRKRNAELPVGWAGVGLGGRTSTRMSALRHFAGLLAALLLGCAAPLARAADDALPLGDLLSAAEEWARENLDPQVLDALGELDRDQVEGFLRDAQARFHGEYVVDLAALKPAAETAVSLLQGRKATRPYAAWLRARLDYFEAAREFELIIPPPEVEPGQPPRPRPNPTPEQERKVWDKLLHQRPLPKGADKLVPRLKPIFTAEGVPAELVWLAEVESSFDATARSAAGAVGLFQLMPKTAERFGLSLSPRDQRREAEHSARAAAQYLSCLHGKFQDWRLALAAYNAGEGAVQRLLDRHQTRRFDRIAPRLPAETQLYVPKVEATLLRREGVSLATLKRP